VERMSIKKPSYPISWAKSPFFYHYLGVKTYLLIKIYGYKDVIIMISLLICRLN
jgi:hypothetical protein